MTTTFLRFIFLNLLWVALFSNSLEAQPRSCPGKVFIYKVLITTKSEGKLRGWLYDADAVQLYLVAEGAKIKPLEDLEPTLQLSADQIKSLKIRRKGSFQRAAIRGGLIGVGVGLGLTAIIGRGRSGAERFNFRDYARAGFRLGANAALFGLPFGFLPAKSFKFNANNLPYKYQWEHIRAYSIKAQLND